MKRHRISCNHAYIDGANLHKGTAALGWRIDYKKFYTWLHEKHHIKRAYIFIGYMPEFDMVLRSVQDIYESVFDQAIIVTSDGDFYSLVNALQEKGKMGSIVSPGQNCSLLLKRTGAPLLYLSNARNQIAL